MVYKAHVENGVVVFDEPISLSEGSKVLVEPLETESNLEDVFKDVVGKGVDLPSDGSSQVDHYVYGTPKR